MAFYLEEVEEFRNEANELLDQAEATLLNIESGASFEQSYDSLFRAINSVKGASGMMKMTTLQQHMEKLENHFQSLKIKMHITRDQVSYFLQSLDYSRRLLAGQNITCDLEFPSQEKSTSTPSSHSASAGPLASRSLKTNNLNPTLFIIDDEEDILEILKDLLELQNYVVKTFTNAREALAQIKTLKPQVILSDMKMPNMTGLELLKEINKFEPDIPVIFISGYLDKEIIIDAIAHGVFGAIEKPFNESQVIAMTNNALKRYQLWKLLSKSIDFLMFQFSNVDSLLKESGKEDIRQIMKNELNQILLLKRELRKNSIQSNTYSKA
ncbi:MAG TPA: response regulator [Pseudobdellovibrionaceae bacterium]|nr:response regulator [Pseudobdellovibrionaceae bacterium]